MNITVTRAFPLVLLALVNAHYIFILVDLGTSGTLSVAQIYNHSKLRKKIEDDTLGLGDDAFP